MDMLIWAGIGYLLGSIPFGLILTALTGGGDIRSIGSGNIGATNVLRTGKKGVAAATLLLDAGKGAAAVWLAQRFGGDMAPLLAGIGAFAGHVHPIWLKFRGGKGVATLLGVSAALCGCLAGRRARQPHLLARRHGRGLCSSRRSGGARGCACGPRGRVSGPLGAVDPPGEYRPAARGHRAADWPQGVSPATLPAEERIARLRLARTDGVGPVSFGQLLQRFGSASNAVAALARMGKPLAAEGVAEREMERASAVGARHLLVGEADYPPLLAEMADPPPVLLVVGDSALAARPVVAMVGARNASAAGRGLALEMAAALGAAGWVVASGLARGIDAEAHRGTLETGTIGCVAGGVDIAYPPENAGLQGDIATRGLLLSEMPPGTEPQARHFPRRNRLIAGVARGVVVIEAAPGSGSLITARIAGEAGREVMAVPGHPRDPRSGGGNGLIRQGATLVEQAADVLAVLSPFAVVARKELPARRAAPARPMRAAPGVPTPAAGQGDLLDLLSVSGVALEEVVRASGLPVASVQAMLSDLEIEGQVVRLAGGRVARVS
jgi:DNA processing protein